MQSFFAGRWPLGLWTAVILFSQTTWAGDLAGQFSAWLFGPGPAEIGSPPFLLQKGFHCFLFAVLGWLLARSGKPLPARQALAVAIGFGGFAELLQWLAPGRHPQWSDAFINVVSATAAWTLAARARDPQRS